MKLITIEVEDNYFDEILNLIKKMPIKIIEETPKKLPLEEIGFIGCGVADENLSINYKEKLTYSLKEKYNI